MIPKLSILETLIHIHSLRTPSGYSAKHLGGVARDFIIKLGEVIGLLEFWSKFATWGLGGGGGGEALDYNPDNT